MFGRNLQTKLIFSFLAVIIMLSLAVALLGFHIIKRDIIDRAQAQVRNDLNFAREIYQGEVDKVNDLVRLSAARYFLRDAIVAHDLKPILARFHQISRDEALDILTLTDADGKVIARARNPAVLGDNQSHNELVCRVLAEKKPVSGTVLIERTELLKESAELADQARIQLVNTPRARPTEEKARTAGMLVKAASPVCDYDGKLIGVLYGGKLLNRRHAIVDRVKRIVFQDIQYKGKDIGTVTVFQDDMRIATNVLREEGSRAVGTRVSQDVYRQVLENGAPWIGRAFVLNDWYKTAYEPIKNTEGRIIGMLYVGTLERPFNNLARNTMLVFFGIVAAAALLAFVLSLIVAACVSRPLADLVKAAGKLAAGEMGHLVATRTGVTELDQLAEAFNNMSAKLEERDKNLSAANIKLAESNKNYIDLIAFVAHELKGVLATVVMNVCSVHDEYLGALNDRQKKALAGATRNLDYLALTIQKFLNLGKIEKGELKANRTEAKMREDIFEHAVNALAAAAARKGMQIENRIAADLKANIDPELMRIAAGNLVSNAVKYGNEGGAISLSAGTADDKIRIEVYNESAPLSAGQQAQLFRRFARLDTPATRTAKGTGLGLFITKEIIQIHGGRIWTEAREKGNAFIFELAKGP
ncbi:MAG: cache domain-containing protein [Kiritimatiellia bacterium]|nr:cache domain-containing protein [Kiritimatiellia bacterium]